MNEQTRPDPANGRPVALPVTHPYSGTAATLPGHAVDVPQSINDGREPVPMTITANRHPDNRQTLTGTAGLTATHSAVNPERPSTVKATSTGPDTGNPDGRNGYANLTADTDRQCTHRATDKPTPDDSTDEPEPWPMTVGLNLGLWVMSGVATGMAATGQLGFADWADVHGPARYGVPVILECFAVVLLLLGYRQGRRKRSPYPLWLLAAGVGAFAVYTNVVHAGPRAGLVFGFASAVAMASWFVKLRLDLTHYLTRIKHIPPARPKVGLLWLTNPRLAVRAKLIAIERRVTSTDKAVNFATVWIAVYDDTRAHLTAQGKKDSAARRLAKRTAWRIVGQMSGAVIVELPGRAEVETVEVSVRVAEPLAIESSTEQPDDPSTSDRQEPATPSGPSTPARRQVNRGPSAASTRTAVKHPSGNLHLVHTDTAKANAAELRRTFPDGLPEYNGQPSGSKVRQAMGWSNDKAAPAIKAYLAGADLEEATG